MNNKVVVTIITLGAIYWLCMIASLCGVAKADLYVYDIEATLTENNVTYVNQEPFYYDIFHIQTDGYATLAFDNYDANLGSSNPDFDYNDPYLYIYTIEQVAFDGFKGGSVQLKFLNEDDDSNEDSPEGLYFYLDDVLMNNQLVAVVSSYDPYVVGTVDFTVTSDKALSIIPEPLAFSLIGVGGISLLILRRKLS